mgnify:FL=1
MSKVIIIGGGAAGMFAALGAVDAGHHVTILEQNEKLGKKIYITGKGRCNLTNACETSEIFENIPRNAKFLYSAIYGYDNFRVIDFFEEHGMPTKTERGNRVFPVSDHSSDVIATLQRTLKNKGVTVRLYTKAEHLEIEEGKVRGVKTSNGTTCPADAVIIATGGYSYQTTGSTGDGYRFAKEESNSQHLQFIPDGTHRMQGHLFAKSWNEVERWVEAIIEKGDPIQKERVERVIYPERFEQSFEEMMFTRKECRLSIYHLDENGSGRDQLFVGMEDLQKKGIMVTADQYRCVYSSLYLPNEDMNAIYSIFNDDPPADYKAHSLSVSDVVIMNQNGDMKAYFVDRFGFQELTAGWNIEEKVFN